ncbi:MAG TPA: gephyrin-like molybdotransferase Glp [Chthoniobacterales bacterium]
MVEELTALETVLGEARVLSGEEVGLLESLGRFLGATLIATIPHPRFDNSVVDGYALRAEESGKMLKVTGEQPAGKNRALSVEAGEAIRIFTGAPTPNGADAVVMQEDVERTGDTIRLIEPVEMGENIRRAGADIARGQVLARKGDKIVPQMIGLLAGQGIARVMVQRKPVVTILSSGDELRRPGETLADGEFYESNSWSLAALARSLGLTATSDLLPDDLEVITRRIAMALETSDVLILSGGVSVGDHDFVKPALKRLGIELGLWRVRIKPGKPLAFAAHHGKLIFGLPGNPVAAFLTFQLFVRPALLQMMGAIGGSRFLTKQQVIAGETLVNRGNRPHYLRGRLSNGQFYLTGLQESHAIFGLAQSEGAVRLGPEEVVKEGSLVDFLKW